MRICSEDGCGSRVLAKGLCGKHYQRQLNTGTTAPRVRAADELCVCGQRFAQYRTANGQALDHPLCQPCYQKARRAQAIPTRLICAREGCGKEFTEIRRGRKMYCSRECKSKAYDNDGRRSEAVLRSYYKSRYGLTPEEAAEMRAEAVGCEICGADGLVGRWGRLVIDHDHVTGKVRGVLCSECNNALGKCKDDPAILQKAIDYLARGAAV